MTFEAKIFITLDTDWVTDPILEFCCQHLLENKISATIFATSRSGLLDDLKSEGLFEIGLHPNIAAIDQARGEIQRLKEIFPDAQSLRSHSLFHCSRLFPILNDLGIHLISNHLAPLCPNLAPVSLPYDTLEFPIYFMDDAHLLMYQGSDKFELSSLRLEEPGIKVFAFHPIHIYLNTERSERYETSKAQHKDPTGLQEFVNTGVGTKTLFLSLLNYIKENSLKTYTLSQWAALEKLL